MHVVTYKWKLRLISVKWIIEQSIPEFRKDMKKENMEKK